jgi:hypothetical protein
MSNEPSNDLGVVAGRTPVFDSRGGRNSSCGRNHCLETTAADDEETRTPSIGSRNADRAVDEKLRALGYQ